MNDLSLFDDDIYSLLSMLVERNKLARIRSSARAKLHRLKKKRTNLLRCGMKVNEIDRAIIPATEQYLSSCRNLATFTKNNSAFRRDMRKKYLTRQRNSASIEVESIALRPVGWDRDAFFCKKDFETIVLENELNDILLGLPQI
jgi:hypothetical protein